MGGFFLVTFRRFTEIQVINWKLVFNINVGLSGVGKDR